MPEAGDAERLVVLLEARVRDFEKNMQKAAGTATGSYDRMRRGSRSATRQMEQDMMRSTNRINQALAISSTKIGAFSRSFAAGAVAPIAGLLTLTSTINGVRAALEKFGDVADRAAASGLDPELYQSLEYQLGLVGVKAEQTGSALAAFAKATGLAEEDTGRLNSQLAKLDPELLKAIQSATTQEERLRAVADALSRIEDPARRAAIATAAFGEAGSKIALAFEGGSAAIDETMRKAQELGVVVSRDLIARADELGDQWDTIATVIDTKLKSALVDLGPHIVYLIGLVADFSRNVAIVLDQFKAVEDRQFIRPLQNQLANLHNARFALADTIKKLEEEDWGLGEALGLRENVLKEKRAEFERMTQEAMRLLDRITELQGRGSVPAPATGETSGSAPGGGKSSVATPVKAFDLGIRDVTDAMNELDEVSEAVLGNLSSGLSGVVKSLLRGEDAIGSVADAFGRLGDQLIEMAIDQAIQGLFKNILGAVTGGVGGGFGRVGSFSMGNMASYDGGGFTGSGPRSGGLDGKGGFPALLHPNETVVDHTRPGNIGHDDLNITVGVSLDAAGNLIPYIERVTRNGIAKFSKEDLPARIDQINRNPLRR